MNPYILAILHSCTSDVLAMIHEQLTVAIEMDESIDTEAAGEVASRIFNYLEATVGPAKAQWFLKQAESHVHETECLENV